MQDQKDKNFMVKLFLAFYSSIKFDNKFYSNNYTLNILLVRDFYCCRATLDLVGDKKKISPYCGHEVD